MSSELGASFMQIENIIFPETMYASDKYERKY